jgi:hypothetical protein
LRSNDKIFVRPLAFDLPFGYNALIIRGKSRVFRPLFPGDRPTFQRVAAFAILFNRFILTLETAFARYFFDASVSLAERFLAPPRFNRFYREILSRKDYALCNAETF